MSLYSVVYMNPMGRAPLGFAEALGMPGYFYFTFRDQNNNPKQSIVNWFPQMVLRPFHSSGAFAYDIDIVDPTEALGAAFVPASSMNDSFHVELYNRNSAHGAPQIMFAYGRYEPDGYGYRNTGPLGPATFQTGPSGPAGPVGATGEQGPQGDPGLRGSRWYTGPGAPSASVPPGNRVDGDMWLNETNGDVYRWNDIAASWMAFKGV
jgi:hypothetical protein